MGFHSKDKKTIKPQAEAPPGWKSSETVASSQNLMLNAFKAMAIDMKRRGRSDDDLSLFAQELTPQSLGLEPNPYTDHIFVQLKERTSLDERMNALAELADAGQL